jgi:hypothetical protein
MRRGHGATRSDVSKPSETRIAPCTRDRFRKQPHVDDETIVRHGGTVSATLAGMGSDLRRGFRGLLALCSALASGCYHGTDAFGDPSATDGTTGSESSSESGTDGVPEEVPAGPTGLRLLTPAQYQSSVLDVLGPVAAPAVGQWRSSLAAAQGGVASAAVEDYEEAAHAVAAEVFTNPTLRTEVTGCEPVTATADDACITSVLETLGRRAWRRPLTEDELTRYASVATTTAELLGGDPWIGLQHAVAGLLQSPNFLYRVELGTPVSDDDPFLVRLDAYELASRISYLVWNTTPDDALLDAAAAGALEDAAGISAQVDRLFASERASTGVTQLFVDMYDLDALLSLQKDPALLPAFTPTVGPALREELVRVIDDTVLEQRDYRRLFDTDQGYVDAELAQLYGIPGDFGPELTPVTLPEPRGGLLTLGGFLAINSGEASTSPTKRGLTVRRVVMCQSIPPPPPGVEANLPEPTDGEPMTKRQMLEGHRTDPACAACHGFMDPIGLALENFDALGGFRATDQGLPIDPSGDLDGAAFTDAAELGTLLADHPATGDCVIRNLYRYASGHIEQPLEQPTIDELTAELVDGGYDLPATIAALAQAESFRFANLSPEDAP